MSTEERLVHMANQIAANFAIAGADKAALATADHIASFWEPTMRRRLFAVADRRDGALGAIAARAVAHLREKGAPPSQTPATAFASAAEGGGSDAG